MGIERQIPLRSIREPDPGDLRSLSKVSSPAFRWLGQSGFAFHVNGRIVLIDPYLSDHLAKKYAGTDRPHDRMMPAPVDADRIRRVDLVLCTHRHSDHMDPGTLSVLAERHPECRFVVPKAEREHALSLGLPADRVTGMDDGENATFPFNLTVHAVAAAHEQIETDDYGHHRFLGFVFQPPEGPVFYHSGDCVPYDGLVKRLDPFGIDLAFLPVNGRDERRRRQNIAGNFHCHEAVRLCETIRATILIPHHYGMFAFNTVDPADLERQIEETRSTVRYVLPDAECLYLVSSEGSVLSTW